MELLAIPLGCQKTATKWLVISPALSLKRVRGIRIRYASFMLTALFQYRKVQHESIR